MYPHPQMTGGRGRQRPKAMLNELDLTDFDQPVEQLSGGQRKRAALVRVLMSEGDILILDEPTNHLITRCPSGWKIIC